MSFIKDLDELKKIRDEYKSQNKKVVFTNGVFDILHAGHVDYLIKSKMLGDVLIVAVNSDASVKKIKGNLRPIVPQNERAFVISQLKPVDYVTIFDDETPFDVINTLIPDILVKGADWSKDKIVGADVVVKHGGKVETIEFVNNTSTTNIIKSVLEKYRTNE